MTQQQNRFQTIVPLQPDAALWRMGFAFDVFAVGIEPDGTPLVLTGDGEWRELNHATHAYSLQWDTRDDDEPADSSLKRTPDYLATIAQTLPAPAGRAC